MTRFASSLLSYRFQTVDSKLDILNLALSGMRDGVGPILTLYLVSELGLAPVELSWVVAASGFAALCAQTPIGFLYDRVENKSYLLALGALLMAIACYSMSQTRSVAGLIGLQVLAGAASCFLSVGMPAVCVHFVRNKDLPGRFARNEIFAKIGNFSALGLTGFLMQKFSLSWVFYMVPILAGPVIWSALRLPSSQAVGSNSSSALMPDKNQALKSADKSTSVTEILKQILSSKRFLCLLFLGLLYEFANSSMFFVYEQAFMKSNVANRVSIISSSLILTQVVITLGFIIMARLKNFTAFQIFSFGFVATILRGAAYACDLGLTSLALGQILDGLIAAIIFTQPVRLLTEIGRANFSVMSGVLGTCISLGSTLSTLFAGYAISRLGTQATFSTFAVMGGFGLAFAYTVRNIFAPGRENEGANPRIATGEMALSKVSL